MINQTLPEISEEQDAIANNIAISSMSQEEYLTHICHMQKLQNYKNHASEYNALSENGLDVTKSADNLKKMFQGVPTGGAGEMKPKNTLSEKTMYMSNNLNRTLPKSQRGVLDNAYKNAISNVAAKQLFL